MVRASGKHHSELRAGLAQIRNALVQIRQLRYGEERERVDSVDAGRKTIVRHRGQRRIRRGNVRSQGSSRHDCEMKNRNTQTAGACLVRRLSAWAELVDAWRYALAPLTRLAANPRPMRPSASKARLLGSGTLVAPQAVPPSAPLPLPATIQPLQPVGAMP